ncbi:hypothetical protein [Micromonospora sp. NPDC126480]|uniref:hypothetical protein n=1 Tax=Micromonospora sp. NPDC126480 TaxID=3155312 RepID=UPI00332F1A78
MPARRKPKKSRTSQSTPTATDLTPVNLDEVAVAPAVPALPVERPAPPTSGPPVAGAPRSGGQRGQRIAQARRYAFRRS